MCVIFSHMTHHLYCRAHSSALSLLLVYCSTCICYIQIIVSGAFLLQSPDGKLVASGAIDGIINLFDLQSGRLLHTLEGVPLGACKGLRYHLSNT